MDATALINAAAALEAHGEVLVARAHHLAQQRDAVRWQSPAARRFRGVLDPLCTQLLAEGNAATALADRMRTCAVRVARAR